ncbi:hypothetical protein [Jiella sp. M17.18]|uniref:hypothetical protein n=1 Tax=Jiella sp. M17.18 TaxID=3234247 RepID=UPI0034DE0D05
MTASALTYAEACCDPNLFGPWFEGDTWATWRVIDKAAFGQPLDASELSTFRELTGRDEAPSTPAGEVWLICGRRSGKDVKAASIAVYLATFGAEIYGYTSRLTRGERGVVQALAVDRDQARVVLGYVKAFFEQPIFAKMVAKDTADGIELTNGLAIEITTNDKRRVRGRTVVAAIFDEVAFWHSDNSVTPDDEVYAAVKPAMVTIPGAMLIGISSPYARRGLLWRKFKAHYGKPGNVLVVKAPTWRMNLTIKRDGEFLTEAFADDPASAAAEFGAEFRSDIEAFISLEAIEACITAGIYERAPIAGVSYKAFTDAAGGSGGDSFTLAIGHLEGDIATLDAVREIRPPFSPENAVADLSAVLKRYGVTEVTGDRWGGEFPPEQFRKHGITYSRAEKAKSDIYKDMLPLVNSGKVDLLDNDRLKAQLVGLERRTARGGRDSIDHAPNAHDDIANAVAGVLTLLGSGDGFDLSMWERLAGAKPQLLAA